MSALLTNVPVDGLWAVFRHSRIPMLPADDQRAYVDADEAASQLLGLPGEGITGMRIGELAPAGQKGAMEDAWRAILAAGDLTGVFELEVPGGSRRDGPHTSAG